MLEQQSTLRWAREVTGSSLDKERHLILAQGLIHVWLNIFQSLLPNYLTTQVVYSKNLKQSKIKRKTEIINSMRYTVKIYLWYLSTTLHSIFIVTTMGT
jgi:hypothetical protein